MCIGFSNRYYCCMFCVVCFCVLYAAFQPFRQIKLYIIITFSLHCGKLTDEDLSRYLNKSQLPLTDPPQLITLETINMITHMVGAKQSLNGSRDLATPISKMVCHPPASTCCPSTYLPNLKYPSSLTMMIRKAIPNVKNGVVWG